VQRYIKSQALSHGVPIIPNYDFDRSIAAVIDLVMERATERADLGAPLSATRAGERTGGTR
jgi:2-phosphoglycerate kinase